MYAATLSSRRTRPASTSCITATAVTIFVTDAMRNRVSGVAGVFAATSVTPNARAYTTRPFSTTATEMAGVKPGFVPVAACKPASMRAATAGVTSTACGAAAASANAGTNVNTAAAIDRFFTLRSFGVGDGDNVEKPAPPPRARGPVRGRVVTQRVERLGEPSELGVRRVDGPTPEKRLRTALAAGNARVA